jgi:NAD(P)-dependent dehydrogenase (short-subunit alcohol dehydrogenase family)
MNTLPPRPVALVTGSSRGIGRAIALHLARHGYDVGIHYARSETEARQVAAEAEAAGARTACLGADLALLPELNALFDRFFEAFPRINLLVNNAGITKHLPFLEATEELWNEVTNLDWKGSYFCAQRAARRMVESGTKGVIINITSIHESTQFPTANIYGPTKAALLKFTRHAALELAPHGIRVNAVSPGCTQIRPGEPDTPRGRQLRSRIPLRRYGQPEEVAAAVHYLASPAAAYITGACLSVDGGALLPSLLDHPPLGDTAS